MEVVKIVTTVFDSLFMFLLMWVGATAKNQKQLGICGAIIIMVIMNLFCMWG
jgi:phosphotransferase system  glucose/maltose/N-acetylglucosamine-specific IIC component